MTAREIYEAVLVEINKENNPSFTIEEFNYTLNKAILALVNEKYNFYPANQQLSDDLRVLIKPAVFNIGSNVTYSYTPAPAQPVVPNYVQTAVVTYNPIRANVLADTTSTTISVSLLADLPVGAKIKLADPTSATIYTITAINGSSYPYSITVTGGAVNVKAGDSIYVETPIAVANVDYTKDKTIKVTLPSSDYLHMISCRMYWIGQKTGDTTPSYLVFPAKRLTHDARNLIENNVYLRPAANRPYFYVYDNQMNSGVTKLAGDLQAYRAYQNKPTIELYIGREKSFMYPTRLEIDYLKLPEVVTLNDIDIFTAGADTSQVLELPDYLKNEVVRRVSIYLIEKMGDPRVSTQPSLNQEIPAVPMNMQIQQAQDARSQQQRGQQ